jgi:hypothetical protein
MVTKEESLNRVPDFEKQSRHYKLARAVLQDVEIYTRYYGFTLDFDWESPYHILFDYEIQRGMKWSVFCSGFNNRLDLQKMKVDTSGNWVEDKRFKERGFGGVKSLMQFLNNRKGKGLGGNK